MMYVLSEVDVSEEPVGAPASPVGGRDSRLAGCALPLRGHRAARTQHTALTAARPKAVSCFGPESRTEYAARPQLTVARSTATTGGNLAFGESRVRSRMIEHTDCVTAPLRSASRFSCAWNRSPMRLCRHRFLSYARVASPKPPIAPRLREISARQTKHGRAQVGPPVIISRMESHSQPANQIDRNAKMSCTSVVPSKLVSAGPAPPAVWK